MKKMIFQGGIVVLAMMVMAGCASTKSADGAGSASSASAGSGRKVGGGVPLFVRDAVKNAPENALVGIGTAKMATLNMSRTLAASRGRAEISRQLQTMVRDMIRDYTEASEVDPSAAVSFQEVFTRSLSESTLQGASVVEEDMDEKDNYWCVVALSKANTVSEINQAAAKAKLQVPKMEAFDAEKRMDAYFDAQVASEVQVVDKD